MSDALPLLDDTAMRRFLTQGYVTVRADFPDDIHGAIHRKLDAAVEREGNPGNNLLARVPEIGDAMEHPAVRGALTSILGADYVMHPHRNGNGTHPGKVAQRIHRDDYTYSGDREPRHQRTRWAMAFYYPQDTTAEMGPTAILPGSQHYMTMPTDPEHAEQLLCRPAGTVTIVNFDIWHRATENRGGDHTRWMLKFIFARMTEPRVPAWEARDPHWQAPADVAAADKHRGMWEHVWRWHHGEDGGVANGAGAPDASEICRLLRDLQSEEIATRRRAADVLGRGGDAAREAVPALVAALGDVDEPTGLNAAYALGAIGEAAVPALAAALRAEAEPVRRHAGYGLTTVGAPAVAALIHASRDTDAQVRALAADALGDMGLPARGAVPVLRDALRDADPWVRRQAADALGTIGPAAQDAVPALIDTLCDELPYVRFNAAFALARLGPAAAEAVPGLERLTHDPDRYARGLATIALRRIGTPAAMETLLRFLETARWCPITDREHPY